MQDVHCEYQGVVLMVVFQIAFFSMKKFWRLETVQKET